MKNFNKEYEQKNKNVANNIKTEQIEIESETFHKGLVTEINWERNKGFVSNKKWKKAIHSFSIPPELTQKIQRNQLISFTLSIPRSFCYSSKKPISANILIANNIDIISQTPLSRKSQIKYHGLSLYTV